MRDMLQYCIRLVTVLTAPEMCCRVSSFPFELYAPVLSGTAGVEVTMCLRGDLTSGRCEA